MEKKWLEEVLPAAFSTQHDIFRLKNKPTAIDF